MIKYFLISILLLFLFVATAIGSPTKRILNFSCERNNQCISEFCSQGYCAEAPNSEDIKNFESFKSFTNLQKKYPKTKFKSIGPNEYESIRTVNGKRIVARIHSP